ncbi:50S ribosomal protein L9 [Deferribacterales bacterium RsTz2092]|nr:50S ribosomal protein L9 [Deferribacterales bacterium]
MKVIFLKDVENVASEGDTKEVKDGFANNYLFRSRLAVEATPANLARLKKKLEDIKQREKTRVSDAQTRANALNRVTINFAAKVGDSGKLFGAITKQDIVKALKEQADYELDDKFIELKQSLKEIGIHEVRVHFYKDVRASFKVIINAEQPA